MQESIIDHIKFVPANLKYKVYILDEAHMLTDHAWNALLKTVEEPPEYAVFIFATTERHKVPATIVSRCQRFEFSRIKPTEIVERLKALSENEKVEVDDEVLVTIAAKTEGCLRDAENLLGQLMSLGEKKITQEIAAIVIPPSQMPIAAELLENALSHDVTKVLERIDELEQQGASLIPLFDDLITATRELLIAKNVTKHADELKNSTEADKKLVSLVDIAETPTLVQASHILMERRREAKHGIDARFALELGLVAIATLSNNGSGQINQTQSFNQPKQIEPQQSAPVNVQNEVKPPDVPTQAVPTKTFEVVEEPPIATDTPKVATNSSSIRIEDVHRIWKNFLQQFEDHKSLLFILKPSKVVSVVDNRILLRLEFAFHKKSLENAKNKQLIENVLCKLLGVDQLTIQGTVDSIQTEGTDAPAQAVAAKDTANSIINAFGGELVN